MHSAQAFAQVAKCSPWAWPAGRSSARRGFPPNKPRANATTATNVQVIARVILGSHWCGRQLAPASPTQMREGAITNSVSREGQEKLAGNSPLFDARFVRRLQKRQRNASSNEPLNYPNTM